MTSYDAVNFVFNIANENNSFSITKPGHWKSESAEKTIDELNDIMELRSYDDIHLHVEQLRKKGLFLIKSFFFIQPCYF